MPGSFSIKRIENHDVDSDDDSGEEADAYAQSQAHLAATRTGRRPAGPRGIAGVPERVGGRAPRDTHIALDDEENMEENEDQALLGDSRV